MAYTVLAGGEHLPTNIALGQCMKNVVDGKVVKRMNLKNLTVKTVTVSARGIGDCDWCGCGLFVGGG